MTGKPPGAPGIPLHVEEHRYLLELSIQMMSRVCGCLVGQVTAEDQNAGPDESAVPSPQVRTSVQPSPV